MNLTDNNYSIITYDELVKLAANYKLEEGSVYRLVLTPANFKDILDNRNKLNRELNLRKATRYAKDMSSGKWDVEGHLEGRIFYFDSLLQGLSVQHRAFGAHLADFTFSEALIAIVSRKAFIKYSHDKRNREDQTLMELKSIDPDVDPMISSAINFLSTKTAGLSECEPRLKVNGTGTNQTSDAQKINLYKRWSPTLQAIRVQTEGLVYTKNLFNALLAFMYCELMTKDDAVSILRSSKRLGLDGKHTTCKLVVFILYHHFKIVNPNNPEMDGSMKGYDSIYLTEIKREQ